MLFPLPKYVFVVDTEQYAGNFERPLCAYVTGCVGECEVGTEEAERFAAEVPGDNPFEEIIEDVPDDETACRRPATVWATPGWFNDGMGGHFRDGDDEAAQQHFVKENLEYSKLKHYADPKHNEEHRLEFEALALQPFTRCPAYLSAAICFSEKPSDEFIALMKRRAADFCHERDITLTGFRLIELTLSEREVDISKL